MKRAALFAVCVLAATAFAAQWHYLSGGKLSGISSVGSFVWAVGQDGLMFVSGDNGQYWRRVPRFTTRNLVDVEFWDQSFGLITAEGDIIYRTTDNGGTWDSSYVQYSAGRIRFVTRDCIWITLSSYMCFLSTDGGRSWTSRVGVGPGVWFLDSLNGWCQGDLDNVRRTTDGGAHWYTVGRIHTPELPHGQWCFGFVNPQDGVCGWQSEILLPEPWDQMGWSATHDGGATWDSLIRSATPGVACDIAPDGFLYGLETKGCMTLGSSGVRHIDFPEPYAFRGLSAARSDHAWICGEGGSIWWSADSGASWASARPQSIELLQNIDFSDTLHGWGASSDWAARTTDAGRSWIQAATNAGISPINDVVALDESTCVVAAGWSYFDPDYMQWFGEFGLGRTTNAGATWDTIHHVAFLGGDGPIGSSRFAHVGNHIWHPGTRSPDANSLRCVDDGATWLDMDAIGAVGEGEPSDISFVDTLNGWAIDPRANICRTTDGGDSWATCALTLNVKRLEMTSLTDGWAISDSELFRTTDSGATWEGTLTQGGMQAIAFCDPSHGAIVGLDGLILRTSDGGETWLQDSSEFTSDLYSVCMLDSTHAWAAGDNGLVLGFGDWALDVAAQQGRPYARNRTVVVRPNPCRGRATVEFSEPLAQPTRVTVVDVTGRVLLAVPVRAGASSVEVDLRRMSSGVYFVRAGQGPAARLTLQR